MWITRTLHLWRGQLGNPFRDVAFNEQRYGNAMKRPAADRRYAIFFTPRSGSSLLTDLARRTTVLGQPGECFNTGLMPGIAKTYSARNMKDYLQLLPRFRNTGGLFGFEITYFQMLVAFRSERRFLDMVVPTDFVWLIREDIVEQAVSRVRMQQTRVAHSVTASEEKQRAAEDRFRYNRFDIRRSLGALLWLEERTEAMFRTHGIEPLRLSYETLVGSPAQVTMDRIARHVGTDLPPDVDLSSDHRKLQSDKSSDYSRRFRDTHPRLMARVERRRARLLDSVRRQASDHV